MSATSTQQIGSTARPRILVTGFGPFPGVPSNPTADLVRSLPRRLMGLKVHRRVLPVSWERAAPALARGVDQVVPHLVLMLGVATQEATGRLENRAFNRLDGRPDAEGALMLPGPIVPTRPMDHSRSCHWPIEHLVKSLHLGGHQLTESNNAGRYLCNHTYYNAFDCPAPAGVGFLHVAPGPLESRHDPRRRLILDLIRALDLWLRT